MSLLCVSIYAPRRGFSVGYSWSLVPTPFPNSSFRKVRKENVFSFTRVPKSWCHRITELYFFYREIPSQALCFKNKQIIVRFLLFIKLSYGTFDKDCLETVLKSSHVYSCNNFLPFHRQMMPHIHMSKIAGLICLFLEHSFY